MKRPLLFCTALVVLSVTYALATDSTPTDKKDAVQSSDPTPVAEKVVPIIGVGSGVRLGGALVTGASSQLKKVTAVAELDGNFSDEVRIRVLIPVSTQNIVGNISRVPETSVTGLINVKI